MVGYKEAFEAGLASARRGCGRPHFREFAALGSKSIQQIASRHDQLGGPCEAVRRHQGLPRGVAAAVVCDPEDHAHDGRLVTEARQRSQQVCVDLKGAALHVQRARERWRRGLRLRRSRSVQRTPRAT